MSSQALESDIQNSNSATGVILVIASKSPGDNGLAIKVHLLLMAESKMASLFITWFRVVPYSYSGIKRLCHTQQEVPGSFSVSTQW
jgi:hypothetical protein